MEKRNWFAKFVLFFISFTVFSSCTLSTVSAFVGKRCEASQGNERLVSMSVQDATGKWKRTLVKAGSLPTEPNFRLCVCQLKKAQFSESYDDMSLQWVLPTALIVKIQNCEFAWEKPESNWSLAICPIKSPDRPPCFV